MPSNFHHQKSTLRRLTDRPLTILEKAVSRRNAIMLTRLIGIFLFVVSLYSSLFHLMMLREGKEYHWIVGVYWTITTMSTLGYGDIVFTSPIGMMFSIVVIITGIFFLLILVPFTLIQLFQSAARVPREVPHGTSGHIILTHFGPVTSVLIEKLGYYSQPYVLVTSDIKTASDLRDKGIKSVVGERDNPETYKQLAVNNAALVVVTDDDITNTTIIHAVRQISDCVPIVTTSTEQESNDILRSAGATEILCLDEMMGQSLARRTIAGDAIAHVIGQFDSITIAEASVVATPLIGKKIKDSKIFELTGVSIVGIFEGRNFFYTSNDYQINIHSVLILAGTQEAISRYNELFCIYNVSDHPVIIIGAGNVGKWVARSFDERGLEYRILEKLSDKTKDVRNVLELDAAQHENLSKAGFFKAPAVVISTHKDDTNIYLATLFRKLRSDIQIVSRATLDRNVSLLHRAGCDIVLSYASFGSNFILNNLKRGSYLMLSEGVDVFKVNTPKSLIENKDAVEQIAQYTNCRVIGISIENSSLITSNVKIRPVVNSQIILIATKESEANFLKQFGREI